MLKLMVCKMCKDIFTLVMPSVIGATVFSVLFLSSNNATAISDYNLSISTNTPTIESEISAAPGGSSVIQKHQVVINTNSLSGAKLFLSSKDNKSTPTYVDGSSPALADGTTTIDTPTGSFNNPSTLSVNSFGFALPSELNTASNPNTPLSNFSSSTIYESSNENIRLTAKFARIPASTALTEIYEATTSGTKSIPVYYGAHINSLLREGKYELDILYTIVSNTPATDIEESNTDTIETSPKLLPVRENQTFYKDNAITIKTNIKSNKSITPADINIKINNKPCTNITISQNFEQNISKTLELTCKAPQNPATQVGSKYDLNLTISKYNINTTKKNAINYIIPTPMQTFQYSMCQNMQTHDEKYVIDTRDDELYTMAKLKDGKCWMTQNLRYQLSATTPLTPTDSDVTQNWTPNRSTETTLTDRWDQDSEDTKTVRSYYDSNNPQYGAYYTHTAATAGTTANMNNKGDEATGSICPKGWRLPKARDTSSESTKNDFYQMAKNYVNSNMTWNINDGSGYWQNGTHNMLSSPQNFVYSGLRNQSSAYVANADSNGWWWSSTVYLSDYAYDMYVRSSAVHPRDRSNRSSGFNVRCIAREIETINSIEYMQEITPELCANSRQEEVATLKDKRDNETYTVAKLKDDKCWMTQNLRLKLSSSTPLKPADSDVQSNWTPKRSTDTESCGRSSWQDSDGVKTIRSCYQSELTYGTNGVYYTHTAATAGTTANMRARGNEATGSICPKGWRLPKTTTNPSGFENDFYNMAKYYVIGATSNWKGSHWEGAHDLQSSPQKFIKSGHRWFGPDAVTKVGVTGSWWSSTIKDSLRAYSLDITGASVDPLSRNNSSFTYNGFTVRCIAR